MKKYILIALLVMIILITGCSNKTESPTGIEGDSAVSAEITGIDEIETDLSTDDVNNFEEDLANFDF